MKNEEEIFEGLNEIMDGKVKEISLIYDLTEYLELERCRDKHMKHLAVLKEKCRKLIENSEKNVDKIKGEFYIQIDYKHS